MFPMSMFRGSHGEAGLSQHKLKGPGEAWIHRKQGLRERP